MSQDYTHRNLIDHVKSVYTFSRKLRPRNLKFCAPGFIITVGSFFKKPFIFIV